MKTIKGFEGEEIAVSDFGEWVGKDYIDYKFEYKNNQKVIKELFKENQELKKQLEDKENQQKEFIDWLENEIENCKYGEENYADGDDMSYHNENELRIEILSKYKEIIGEKE